MKNVLLHQSLALTNKITIYFYVFGSMQKETISVYNGR